MNTEDTGPPAPEEIDFKEYLRQQQEIAINDPFNRWVTGVELGRKPNDTECVMHFILFGGAEMFARGHRVKGQ